MLLIFENKDFISLRTSMHFYFQRKEQPILSEQQPKVQDAEVPFPLYSCVHVKKDVSAQEYCGKYKSVC